MITLTKEEHSVALATAEATFLVKAYDACQELKRGEDIDRISTPLGVAYCNLLLLENYKTGEFDPAEYFNVVSPYGASKSFSNVNNIYKNKY